jgi:hypothetical protein
MSVYKLSVCPKNGGKKYDKMTFSIPKIKIQNSKNVTLSAVEGQILILKSQILALTAPLLRGAGGVFSNCQS